MVLPPDTDVVAAMPEADNDPVSPARSMFADKRLPVGRGCRIEPKGQSEVVAGIDISCLDPIVCAVEVQGVAITSCYNLGTAVSRAACRVSIPAAIDKGSSSACILETIEQARRGGLPHV